ncbi:zinc-binding alcohol dehydrogenase family protein [Leptospira kanakyensis]|uniref:Zinc-type alcohol dehydrogenase-like protein n=1 Tax=Leptospira kanakyensis TaxID=2484968 RepID=A0A6N4QA84_9LEPT|nr:zinc-binding alcohol dehydrogenase family protein [Leptospira kanakyensis]TGK53496.1 zinc-binding alcohol dehydrogenase family protein [Leptospira kanakyensis]TGK57291.1 zinc-binding alcohol dehydrogenase family protein [Leptospira kanakyensis]TGK73002.1 zinc-binding alcohol dehydrogenase family protein [Leptospira kanakyensis]
MKAIVSVYDAKENKSVLRSLEIPKEPLGDHDVRVQVMAVSVNPVDYKVRNSISLENPGPRILGWDAAGVVTELGAKVSTLKLGEEVYYAGDIKRPGSNAEFQVVDEWIVGKKPKNLNFKEAASLPLTTITAYESIFEKLKLDPMAKKIVLIVAGAGGVGSIAIQILKQMTKANVIATASREESIVWVKSLGADLVVNPNKDYLEQIQSLGQNGVNEVLLFSDPKDHFENLAKVLLPFGNICSIVESGSPINMNLLKSKSNGYLNEFMFTRSMYQTEDRIKQKQLLEEIAVLVEKGKINPTNQLDLGEMTEESLNKAHELLQTGKTIGKIVLGGMRK